MNGRLTAREVAVLQLLARGCTCGQAAGRLGISQHTVASHLKSAYRKLEVHSAAAAVMRAVQLQMLDAEAAGAIDGTAHATIQTNSKGIE